MAKQYTNYIAQEIQLELAKHYKKKDLEFDYIPVKKFKEIDKNDNPSVIGSIKLENTNKTKVDLLTIMCNDKAFNFEVVDKNDDPNDKDNRKNKSKIMGYIKVAENTYISIIKTNIILIILFPALAIALLSLGLLISYITDINNPNPNPGPGPETTQKESLEIESGESITSETIIEDEKVQESITIPGYANLYVSTKNPNISLINPEGNTVYMKYTIKNGDEVIYETKALEPNKMIKANLKELLPNGEYTLTFIIETFDVETQNACNGATQEVKFLVKD